MNNLKRHLSQILILCVLISSVFSASAPVQAASNKVLDQGVYIINSAVNTSMVIDVNGNRSNNGTKIQLWTENRGAAQQFRLEYKNGYSQRFCRLLQ